MSDLRKAVISTHFCTSLVIASFVTVIVHHDLSPTTTRSLVPPLDKVSRSALSNLGMASETLKPSTLIVSESENRLLAK